MATIEAALYSFWNSFGIPAYEENTVPDDAAFPYITYEVIIGDFDSVVPASVNVWYRSYFWADVNSKAREISQKISHGGYMLPCDGGGIWIVKGNPFAQNMSDPEDDLIKRKYINLMYNYITTD